MHAGHAKILVVMDGQLAEELARRCVEEGWSVRQLEEYLETDQGKRRKARRFRASGASSPVIREVEERLQQVLATKVRIKDRDGKGRIEVEYYSTEELNRILDVIGGGLLDE